VTCILNVIRFGCQVFSFDWILLVTAIPEVKCFKAGVEDNWVTFVQKVEATGFRFRIIDLNACKLIPFFKFIYVPVHVYLFHFIFRTNSLLLLRPPCVHRQRALVKSH
jgi:hypothetical protein